MLYVKSFSFITHTQNCFIYIYNNLCLYPIFYNNISYEWVYVLCIYGNDDNKTNNRDLLNKFIQICYSSVTISYIPIFPKSTQTIYSIKDKYIYEKKVSLTNIWK